jgi:UDP-GlcNAc:undecaprenyl-phosphate GlcNAc-1-phosphate transferase
MDYLNLIIIMISAVLSYVAAPILIKILNKGNALGTNYLGEKIPNCMGLLFIFVQVFIIAFIYLFFENENYYIVYLFSFIFMGLVGFMDDLIGEKEIKGLRGHILNFIKGNPTTGGIKAGVGFIISLFVSLVLSRNMLEVLINTIIIALFTNLINLFDLRPGRSTKVFILFAIIMLFFSTADQYNKIIYSFLGILFVYLPLDLKAKVMMGDVGSNTMGITLGIYCVLTQNIIAKLIYLLLLFTLHVVAERVSFTKIIENNRLLKFLDNLGR